MEEKLRNWFIEMGYPLCFIPPEPVFQRLCNDRMNVIWEQLINKIKSRQYVHQIRLNILLHEVQTMKTQNEINTDDFTSNQIVLWNEKEVLKKRISELDAKILNVEDELNQSQYKMKVESINVVKPLEDKLEKNKKYVSLVEEKHEQLNKELAECNIMYESVKKLNLVRNNSCQPNEEIFKKIEKNITNKNDEFSTSHDGIYNIHQENNEKINDEYIRNFSLNNLYFWELITQSKINTIRNLKTLTESNNNIENDSLTVPQYLGSICADYNNYKLENIHSRLIIKKSESEVQLLLENSDSDCVWRQKYLNKVGYIASINTLRNEIGDLKKKHENVDVHLNVVIQEVNNLKVEIEKENESVESKLLKFHNGFDQLLNYPISFENIIQKFLFNIKDLQKKYFCTDTNSTSEIELVLKTPEMYLENNLPTRAIDPFDSMVIPSQILAKIVNSSQPCPISMVVDLFEQKLIMEIIDNLDHQELKALEKVNLNKFLNTNFDINKESIKHLVEQLKAIKIECMTKLSFQMKLDEIFEFWEKQPMKTAISETRLFNGLPFSFYEKEYDDYYESLFN